MRTRAKPEGGEGVKSVDPGGSFHAEEREGKESMPGETKNQPGG